MTALSEFQRLEAQGSWRESPDARLREVVVSFGDATLMLSDPKSDTPLSHWSLPAVTRLNPGKSPAIFSPGPDDRDETVEIEDPVMIEAIARVHRAIASRRAHPGRLRDGLTVVAILAMLAALVFWLPDTLVRHAARIAPPAQARQIGEAVLADVERSTGAVCKRQSGQAVLDWLTPRLLGDEAAIRVVPGPLNTALRLPGDLYVMGADLLVGASGPEAAAGHLLAARQVETDKEARQEALGYAGLTTALRLMTLGSLPEGAMTGYGPTLLSNHASRRGDDQALLAQFARVGISSQPYARSIDPTGASVLPLIEGDPFRSATPPKPLLTDQQWLALQQICAG
ncbi:MAG: hypothetical protein ACU0BG_16175 [Paracoccus sp. (in: a-proteobacteria)]|jgi:hypothetical protein|uniref:hypothetical protein n=1 Tax=unclassified Paracoccus (in: a-proteobacteria) TaxID=2688777 RepID=UPI000C4DE52E|nr:MULTISPECIES: hypothetical protein [unclassified Paracoccus (in: a-proteobacteria)]MAN57808.1 hypothetical protein [Paracoccus sp. (in: a-proteobacteria)]|tara:strand:- start:15142 stop:16167 length:1026 start_codon:yes stop_codon:yes gene_type:complete